MKKRSYLLLLCSLLFAVFFSVTAFGAVARGDIDENGELEVSDARYALRAAVGLDVYPEGTPPYIAADVDRSGEIEVSDARTILRAAVGLDLLSYNDKFYMPLTIADTDDFSVTVVQLFHDDMVQGFDLDVTNKHASHTLEIDFGNVVFNGYQPDSSHVSLELNAGETQTTSIFFDRDLVDASTFIYGWIRDLRMQIEVYDLSAGTPANRPRLFSRICGADPNRVDEDDHTMLTMPIAEEQIMRAVEGRYTFAMHGPLNVQTDESGEEPDLVNYIVIPIYCRNDTDRDMYFNLEDFDLGWAHIDRNPGNEGKYLLPHTNGCTTVILDVRAEHMYRSDLDMLGFTLRITDSGTAEEIYSDRYYFNFGMG